MIWRGTGKISGTVGFISMLNEDLTFNSWYGNETTEPSGMPSWEQLQGYHWFSLQLCWVNHEKYCAGHFERSLAVTKEPQKCSASPS